MTEVREILEEVGLSQYSDVFLEQGFDTWDTLLEVTESDFDKLGVKLGHRRKLQRRIANITGLAINRAPVSPKRSPPTDDDSIEDRRVGRYELKQNGAQHGRSSTSTGKRKYRRHPKPDEHAPERPISAYVIFSNKMREDLKGRQLSFAEIAKLVGENWQSLSPKEKEPYESQAAQAKELYNVQLAEYKKTDAYRQYMEYLQEFKAKQSGTPQDPTSSTVMTDAKRPKLIGQSSAESESSTDSGLATDGHNIRSRDQSHFPWGYGAAPLSLSPSAQLAGLPSLSVGATSNSMVHTGSPQVLPGYRDTLFGHGQHAIPWRDVVRGSRETEATNPQHLPRIMDANEQRASLGLSREQLSGSLPPPLLTSESTSGTSKSSVSSGSTTSYMTPRTPIEPTIVDRQNPLNSFPSKQYELPPIRPPSHSPKDSLNVPYHRPATTSGLDYAVLASRRGSALPSPIHPHTNRSGANDIVLDPLSALLKAGELVNRNSQS